ncbi:MAG: YlxM family DNA-binding protein [Clostridia bacterium]|nr:YlxM family DNA-binding protein [Clostridia bacterium]
MSKNLNVSILMDFYGQLLTPKQLEALDFYYNEDLSLGEIADEMKISRQGVRDFIKRGEKQLDELEEKLGLAGRFSDIKSKIEEINSVADALAQCVGSRPELDRLRALTSQVIDEL